jgi:hypothetical protein
MRRLPLPEEILRKIVLLEHPLIFYERFSPGDTIDLHYHGGSNPGGLRRVVLVRYVSLSQLGGGFTAQHGASEKNFAICRVGKKTRLVRRG